MYEEFVENIDLYLFDTDGYLVNSYSYRKDDLYNYKALLPMQEEGDYLLVASVNNSDDYSTSGKDDLQSFQISLKTDEANIIRRKQADIYHGMQNVSFTPSTWLFWEEDTVPLYKNTNHINVSLTYNGYTSPGESTLNMFIEGNNGTYDYKNDCMSSSLRTYYPHSIEAVSEKVDRFRFTTMQLYIGSDLLLYLQDKNADGKIILNKQLNILSYLSRIYPTNDHLDQEDIFNIDLTIDGDFQILELKINDWFLIRGGEEV